MRLYKIYTLLFLLGATLLAGCSSDKIGDALTSPEIKLGFQTNLTSNEGGAATWEVGDAIGIYAVNAGEKLFLQSIYRDANNSKYQTDGSSSFKSSTPIILDGVSPLDIKAYYPYQSTIKDFKIDLDVTNQSTSKLLDFLYADNVKNLTNQSSPELKFQHKLAKVIFHITKGMGIDSLDNLRPNVLKGLVAKGAVSLNDGEVSLAAMSSNITHIDITSNGDKKVVEIILLPNQDLSNSSLSFQLDNDTFLWSGKKQHLESGKKYTYNIEFRKENKIPEVLLLNSSTIADWEVGYEDLEESILIPDEPKEELIFLETYDKANKVEKDENNKYLSIAAFKNYDNKHIIFTDATGNVDVRSTKSYPNFVWFPSNRDCELQLAGLGFTDYQNIRMQVKVTVDITAKKGNFDVSKLKLFFDGQEFAVPSRILTSEDTNTNKFYALEYKDLPKNFNEMKFAISAADNHGIRLGNISIWGIK